MGTKATQSLSFLRLLWLTLLATALSVAVGAWITYRRTGGAGLDSALAAAGVVLAVMLGTGLLILRVARHGSPLAAIQLFFGAAAFRMPLTIGLAVAVWQTFELSPKPLLIWVACLYVLLVGVECVWLVQGLKLQESHECRTEQPGNRESSSTRL